MCSAKGLKITRAERTVTCTIALRAAVALPRGSLRQRKRATGVLLGVFVWLGASCSSAPRAVGPDSGGGSLCESEAGLDLAALSTGGAPAAYGSDVLYENGTHALVVDRSCGYAVRGGLWNEARMGPLTQEDVSSLEETAQLSKWADVQGSYCYAAFDGPDFVFWYRGATIWIRACGYPGGPAPALDPREPLRTFAANLYSRGAALAGPVRFALVRRTAELRPGEEDKFRGGQPWPLAGAPANVAAMPSQTEPYPLVPIHVASGADAVTLGSLRAALLAGTIGNGQFIPIVENDGALYELYVRDVLPFEDESGMVKIP